MSFLEINGFHPEKFDTNRFEINQGSIADSTGTDMIVNPAHLHLGDQKQNAADRRAAGRVGTRYMPVEKLYHPHLSRRGQLTGGGSRD